MQSERGKVSPSKELEQLRAQYGVTVKVVKAQGEYITDLESKNLALTKHIKEGKSDDSDGTMVQRLVDLKRGVEYYKAQGEQVKKENEELRAKLTLAEADMGNNSSLLSSTTSTVRHTSCSRSPWRRFRGSCAWTTGNSQRGIALPRHSGASPPPRVLWP